MDIDPRPLNDVAKPGSTAANPSSKPIIVTNAPQVKDPMMSPNQAPPTNPRNNLYEMTPEEFADAPINQKTESIKDSVGGDHANPETGQKIQHDQPMFGEMKKSNNKGIIISLIALSIILAIVFYLIFVAKIVKI